MKGQLHEAGTVECRTASRVAVGKEAGFAGKGEKISELIIILDNHLAKFEGGRGNANWKRLTLCSCLPFNPI